jgi:hypothetical protein
LAESDAVLLADFTVPVAQNEGFSDIQFLEQLFDLIKIFLKSGNNHFNAVTGQFVGQGCEKVHFCTAHTTLKTQMTPLLFSFVAPTTSLNENPFLAVPEGKGRRCRSIPMQHGQEK